MSVNSGRHRVLGLVIVVCLASSVASSAQSGTARGHDGLPIYFEVHGSGDEFLFLGPGTALPRAMGVTPGVKPLEGAAQMMAAAKQVYIGALADDYRLILIEYPGPEPKMYTLTPGTVARDYLAIADAAGAETFAYAGFSWGCVTGLQLALRTERMTALVCGGFPVIDGVYQDMLRVTRSMSEKPTSIYGLPALAALENGRQFYTYYQGLRSFDDRAALQALSIPRLSWIGDADQPTLDGEKLTHMGQVVVGTKAELEAAGWDVLILPGRNHLDAGAPEVQVPVIKNWLAEISR